MGDVAARMTDDVERCNRGDGTDRCKWCITAMMLTEGGD